MKNTVLDMLKKTIVSTLNAEYGYCGCADGENVAIINSGKDGENLIITIKDQSAIDAAK